MSQTSLGEIVESWQPGCLEESGKEKVRILEEFVALKGYHRKSAIRFLSCITKLLVGQVLPLPGITRWSRSASFSCFR